MKRLGLALALFTAACSGGGGTADAPPHPDAAPTIDGAPTSDASCFTNPTTHKEIINACTDSTVVKIDKQPVLPLLNPDGTLPPLP